MAQIGKPPCDEAVIRFGGPASACSARSKRWVLVAAIVGSSMAFIDGTVVNVALPAIQRDFDATAFEAQWVVESYALLLAALLLVGGSLGDRFGRRRIFMLGTAVFALASIACGLSTSVQALIAARALQGVGAALLVPGSLALISAGDHVRAVALVGPTRRPAGREAAARRRATGFMPAVIVLGLGMAITVAPLTTTVMNAVAPDSAGIASGVNNAVSRAAAVLAIAVFGIVMASVFDANLGAQLGALNAPPNVVAFLEGQRGRLVEAQLPPGIDLGLASKLEGALASAFVAGFRAIMVLSAGLALVSALVAWRTIESRPKAAVNAR